MNKVKRFWKKNKYKIINTLVTIGTFALGYTACSYIEAISVPYRTHEPDDDTFVDDFMTALKESERHYSALRDDVRIVDEDIFTNVAPQIEDAVLTEGLDEAFIKANYVVRYPKNGSFDNGAYTTHKLVEINITDATE